MAARPRISAKRQWSKVASENTDMGVLRIAINRPIPDIYIPGTEASHLYWKIGFELELAKIRFYLYVPPEWRNLTQKHLTRWVNQLRDRPFEDIILGGTLYRWELNALIPDGQDRWTIAIQGVRGQPTLDSEPQYWAEHRLTYSDGSNLPVAINRARPEYGSPGMEKYLAYWPIQIPTLPTKTQVWVPPEWHRLTVEALEIWKYHLAINQYKNIKLGGVEYTWNDDEVLPVGQEPTLLMSRGFDVFSFVSAHDSDEETRLKTFLDKEKESDVTVAKPTRRRRCPPRPPTPAAFLIASDKEEEPQYAEVLEVNRPETPLAEEICWDEATDNPSGGDKRLPVVKAPQRLKDLLLDLGPRVSRVYDYPFDSILEKPQTKECPPEKPGALKETLI